MTVEVMEAMVAITPPCTTMSKGSKSDSRSVMPMPRGVQVRAKTRVLRNGGERIKDVGMNATASGR